MKIETTRGQQQGPSSPSVSENKNTTIIASYLSVLVQNVSEETISVGKSLRACTLSHADHSVLLRMQDTALEFKRMG